MSNQRLDVKIITLGYIAATVPSLRVNVEIASDECSDTNPCTTIKIYTSKEHHFDVTIHFHIL